MTGIYVRVRRDGQWQSVAIDRLTDEELATVEHDFLKEGPTSKGWGFARELAKWVRDNVHQTRPTVILRDVWTGKEPDA